MGNLKRQIDPIDTTDHTTEEYIYESETRSKITTFEGNRLKGNLQKFYTEKPYTLEKLNINQGSETLTLKYLYDENKNMLKEYDPSLNENVGNSLEIHYTSYNKPCSITKKK
ncbi:hypothetical protein MHK_003977 [Candidatus Magnetomorum sp. HK-1]|nr:hypothetical protein MHK_003977 [Candidatus Magnetomorum sp. HK-1]